MYLRIRSLIESRRLTAVLVGQSKNIKHSVPIPKYLAIDLKKKRCGAQVVRSAE